MSRPKILLVDDDRLFLELEKDFLKQSAVMVYTAADGREALDSLKMVRPDLIFMDLHMPEVDGATCCKVLKTDPHLSSIPVVMVSVAGHESDLERCRAAGCDGILTKPIRREEFLAFGHQFLRNIDEIELRVPCRSQVVFTVNGRAHYGMSADLSSCGIFVAFKGEIMVDDHVRLSFLLREGSELIEAVGRVAWINGGAHLLKPALPQGFGVEFTKISPEAVGLIREYMNEAAGKNPQRRIEEAYFVKDSFF